MGLHHEQKSYLHHDYIRINFQNVMPGKYITHKNRKWDLSPPSPYVSITGVTVVDRVKEYQEEDPSSSRTFGYYDLGTSMHYNKFVSTICKSQDNKRYYWLD